MGSKGSSTQNTTQNTNSTATSSPNPAAMQAYLSLLNQVQGVASTPYQAYGGQEVAPINQQQLTGVGNVNTAAGNITAAGAPLTANDVQKWMSPYTQDVVNATQNQFNENNARANSIVTGNAAAQGALGGDRVGVAQALTQGQLNQSEAPVIAGLYNTGYGQALNTAEQQQGFGLNAAQAQMGAAQNQIGAGTLEQQNQQQQDTQARADYYQQQGYPFQTAQWLAQMETGVGSQLGGTSTSTGTGTSVTQGPTPNTWAQLAGLGIAGASLFLKRGGRVKRAAGGYSGPYAGVDSWVPADGAIMHGAGAPHAQPMQMSTPRMSADQSGDNLTKQAMGFAQKWQNSPDDPTTMGSPGVTDALPMIGAAGDYAVPTFMADGGGVARGGYGMASFPAYERRGFQDGGAPWDLEDRFDAAYPSMPPMSFADRYPTDPMGPALTQGFGPDSDALISDAYRRGVVPGVVPDPGLQAVSPQSMQDWRDTPATPTQAAAKPDDDESDDETTTTPAAAQPVQGVGVGQPFSRDDAQAGFGPQPQKNFLGFNKLTPDMRNALLTAGLSMMATRRGGPGSFLGASGEAGIAGVGAYNAAQKAQADRDLQQQKMQMEQQRLTQEARDSAERLRLTGASQAETARHNKFTEGQESYTPIGSAEVTGADGTTQVHPLVVGKSTGKVIDAVTGQTPDASAKITPKGTKASLSDEDAQAVASRYVDTGDRTQLMGLGYSGENRAKVNHFIAQIQKDKNVSNEELAQRVADFEGRKASARTLSTMESKMGSAGFEAEGAINLARGVVEKLPRTSFLPVNKLIAGYEHGTLNTDQIELMQRLQAIKNTYAAVMARGSNVTTDAARARGDELLDSAYDAPSMNKVFDVMLSEINMARNSPEQMRQFYRSKYGANSVAPAGAAPATTFTPPAGAIARQYQGKTYYYDPATKQPYPGQ